MMCWVFRATLAIPRNLAKTSLELHIVVAIHPSLAWGTYAHNQKYSKVNAYIYHSPRVCTVHMVHLHPKQCSPYIASHLPSASTSKGWSFLLLSVKLKLAAGTFRWASHCNQQSIILFQ
ncbi:hypothetical protein B0T25DRAFT_25469 [Lasiosphaeria hispida]|uniref:Uncharacterized protein n=1 Tax=Lasiosphaeria hispida TaxID=260671 RepID=A0AAJ0HUP9_9PEZI|nr:hypothetical protein B0T25DRAFT_25469 [Lasiosphaeria hispida]